MPEVPELNETIAAPSEASMLSKVSQLVLSSLTQTKNAIPQGLVYIDHTLDLIPLAGTASNVLDLGLKHIFIKDMDPNSSYFKAYIEHMQTKQTKECVAYGIPFVGTLAKLGSIVYNLYSDPSKQSTGYEVIDIGEAALDEFMGMSTIGHRLRQQEASEADFIANQFNS